MYGEKPVAVFRRSKWEFQAVIKGAISVLLPEGPDALKSKRLWLFPPQHSHGWTGAKENPAEVVVFHFQFVPAALESLARSSEFLEIRLTDKQCARVRELAEQAFRYWRHPSVGMAICFEHILMELSLMILEASGPSEPSESNQRGIAGQRVDAAMQWFVERMEENPSLEVVAGAVGSSPAHLRRMFGEVMAASPKKIFDQLRFQRSMLLMSEPEITLEIVGERCGFASASAFSRAFKNKFGCSPEAWRMQVLVGGKEGKPARIGVLGGKSSGR